MPRISGIDIPGDKAVAVGLTRIYGLGRTSALKITEALNIDPWKKVHQLTEGEIVQIRHMIDGQYRIEGDLRRDHIQAVKRLMDLGCYRGLRHRRGLPARGQRTHTNARSRKGPRRTAIKKKRIAGKKT
jgi:small subunit ribosomal protein S13